MKHLRKMLLSAVFMLLLSVMMIGAGAVHAGAETAIPKPGIYYRTQIRGSGWTKEVRNGASSGTAGSGARIQGLRVRLTNNGSNGSVVYNVYSEGTGWLKTWQRNGAIAKSETGYRRVEAIKLRLSGKLAENFDIWYRVYIPKFGWLGWAKNGAVAGTKGYDYRIESVEIKLTAKKKTASDTGAYRDAAKRKIVCLDPGHTGTPAVGREPVGPGSGTYKAKDSGGATGRYTRTPEYVINLQVGLKLRSELEKRDYKVVMTRTNNTTAISNVERAGVANRAKADIFVRIHANWDDASYVNGALMMNITRYNPYIRSNYAESRRLSDCIISAVTAATGLKRQDTIETDNLTANNWAAMPTTLIEMGFMSNYSDDTRLVSSSFQTKIAKGMADGIDKYFGR